MSGIQGLGSIDSYVKSPCLGGYWNGYHVTLRHPIPKPVPPPVRKEEKELADLCDAVTRGSGIITSPFELAKRVLAKKDESFSSALQRARRRHLLRESICTSYFQAAQNAVTGEYEINYSDWSETKVIDELIVGIKENYLKNHPEKDPISLKGSTEIIKLTYFDLLHLMPRDKATPLFNAIKTNLSEKGFFEDTAEEDVDYKILKTLMTTYIGVKITY